MNAIWSKVVTRPLPSLTLVQTDLRRPVLSVYVGECVTVNCCMIKRADETRHTALQLDSTNANPNPNPNSLHLVGRNTHVVLILSFYL